jgi:hypothetical protein
MPRSPKNKVYKNRYVSGKYVIKKNLPCLMDMDKNHITSQNMGDPIYITEEMAEKLVLAIHQWV